MAPGAPAESEAAMYRLAQRFRPGLGKEAEVRALLTEVAQHLQTTEERDVGLSTQLFSSDGPALVLSTRTEDLNTLEQYRRRTLADAEWRTRVVNLVQLLRAPVEASVAEILIGVPTGSGPTGIVTAALGFPALGKDPDFRSITADAVKASQAAGVRRGMSARLFSPIGQVYEVLTAYADLGAFDVTRKERMSITTEVIHALHAISREPMRQGVFEVLVPFRN